MGRSKSTGQIQNKIWVFPSFSCTVFVELFMGIWPSECLTINYRTTYFFKLLYYRNIDIGLVRKTIGLSDIIFRTWTIKLVPMLSRCSDQSQAHSEQICSGVMDIPVPQIWQERPPAQGLWKKEERARQGSSPSGGGDHDYSGQVWKAGWGRRWVTEKIISVAK